MSSTDNIILRAIEPDDALHFFHWVNNDRVNAGATFRILPWSQRRIKGMIERGELENDDKRYLVIEAEGQPIGLAIFRGINRQDRSAELGIVIGETEYWNQGYSWPVGEKMLKLSFHGLGLHRVYVYVPEFNRASGIMAALFGFTKEGVIRDCFYRDGRFWDATIYSLLEDEWREVKDSYTGAG